VACSPRQHERACAGVGSSEGGLQQGLAWRQHRGVLVHTPLTRGELDKGSTSRRSRSARGHDSARAYVTRDYVHAKAELGSSLGDVHASTNKGRKWRVLHTLAGSNLETASWCTAVPRGNAGHNDGLEKLDGGLPASMIGGGGYAPSSPWHRAAWPWVLRRLSDGQPQCRRLRVR
jgi:hypothetical protein